MESWKEFLETSLIDFGIIQISAGAIIQIVLIIFTAWCTIWVLQRILHRYFKSRDIDSGRQYALIAFLKYIVYTITFLVCLESIGISITLLMGGAAALLVGIGLGLQQTFNDLISGIILLVEGANDVGDIIEVDGRVGQITRIGIRTSSVETRDQISVVIPNSKLASDNAVNWSHNKSPTRFAIPVGVSYKSDIRKVTEVLLNTVDTIIYVLKDPNPEVQFRDFGNSSLDFILFFYSYKYMHIERIKSEIRYAIFDAFSKHDIEIPFPQRDLWIKNPEVFS